MTKETVENLGASDKKLCNTPPYVPGSIFEEDLQKEQPKLGVQKRRPKEQWFWPSGLWEKYIQGSKEKM